MEPSLSEEFVAATGALLAVIGADERILLANPALQRFTGRTADELLGRFFWEVWVLPEHVELAQDAITRAIATGTAQPQEADWLTGDGGRRRVAMHNDVLRDCSGRPYAVATLGIDVTDQRQREARLHQRAETDRLTGIPHRGALFDALRRHLDPVDGAGCAVLFCDLDRFKVVNDDHGHGVGDRLLSSVAGRLSELVRAGEVAARFGGDEFVLLVPGDDPERVSALTGRVAAALAAPFDAACGPLSVGVSVGVAVGRPGESPDELIARADRAMYGSKTHRRRRIAADGAAQRSGRPMPTA
ncbi:MULTISPECIES: GGDEF domain-containing protein [unclassified Geodermatophilus]|uniref:GGDEF domain-containing protein n=1 Tax=unclassified Geodermatophilus TaxID=2637632 RepID=UPI003EEDCB73